MSPDPLRGFRVGLLACLLPLVWLRAAVPVLDGDTAESLHARIQVAERELYPAAVAAIARGEVKVRGRLTAGFANGN